MIIFFIKFGNEEVDLNRMNYHIVDITLSFQRLIQVVWTFPNSKQSSVDYTPA